MRELLDLYIGYLESNCKELCLKKEECSIDIVKQRFQEVGIEENNELISWFSLIGNMRVNIFGLMLGMNILNFEEMVAEWSGWRDYDDVYESSRYSSFPVGAIQCKYSCSGWIPLCHDGASNYIGVDLNPGQNGRKGQIINFGRDEDDKVVLFSSITNMMEEFVNLQAYMKLFKYPDEKIFYLNEDKKHSIDWLKELKSKVM